MNNEIMGKIIWDKNISPFLDFLRAYTYEFYNPEESYGKPDVLDSKEIYAWENVIYDGDEKKQTIKALLCTSPS